MGSLQLHKVLRERELVPVAPPVPRPLVDGAVRQEPWGRGPIVASAVKAMRRDKVWDSPIQHFKHYLLHISGICKNQISKSGSITGTERILPPPHPSIHEEGAFLHPRCPRDGVGGGGLYLRWGWCSTARAPPPPHPRTPRSRRGGGRSACACGPSLRRRDRRGPDGGFMQATGAVASVHDKRTTRRVQCGKLVGGDRSRSALWVPPK